MVGAGPGYARYLHGGTRRDGRQRRHSDHHVRISYRHFVGRVDRDRVYDYDDHHAAFVGVDCRPVRQQAFLYRRTGAVHARFGIVRAGRQRRFPDRGSCVAGSRQRDHPVARTGYRDPRVSAATTGIGARPVGRGRGRVHFVRAADRRLPGGRFQLALDLRRQRPDRHPGDRAVGGRSERVEKPGAGTVRLGGLRQHRVVHAAFGLRARQREFPIQPGRMGFAAGDRLFRRCGRRAGRIYRGGIAASAPASEYPAARRPAFRGRDDGAFHLRHRYAGRHLPVAVVHAEGDIRRSWPAAFSCRSG